MSNNLTRGAFQVYSNSPVEINLILRRIRDELDEIQGLRGRAEIFDRTRVSDPTEASDALTQGAAKLTNNVTVDGTQTITGAKTFSAKAVFSAEVELDGALNHDGTTVGLYNTTPVVQATASADLTDNSGGTANNTVQALTDPADTPATADVLRDDLVANLIPELRNNFADLTAKVNKALQVIRNIGMMAT